MFSSVKRILVKFALRILKSEVLEAIQYAPAQEVLANTYARLDRAANIVLDNDPDNKTQFQQFWKEEKKPLAIDAVRTAKAVLNEELEGNERVRGYLNDLLDEIQQAIEQGPLLAQTRLAAG